MINKGQERWFEVAGLRLIGIFIFSSHVFAENTPTPTGQSNAVAVQGQYVAAFVQPNQSYTGNSNPEGVVVNNAGNGLSGLEGFLNQLAGEVLEYKRKGGQITPEYINGIEQRIRDFNHGEFADGFIYDLAVKIWDKANGNTNTTHGQNNTGGTPGQNVAPSGQPNQSYIGNGYAGGGNNLVNADGNAPALWNWTVSAKQYMGHKGSGFPAIIGSELYQTGAFPENATIDSNSIQEYGHLDSINSIPGFGRTDRAVYMKDTQGNAYIVAYHQNGDGSFSIVGVIKRYDSESQSKEFTILYHNPNFGQPNHQEATKGKMEYQIVIAKVQRAKIRASYDKR